MCSRPADYSLTALKMVASFMISAVANKSNRTLAIFRKISKRNLSTTFVDYNYKQEGTQQYGGNLATGRNYKVLVVGGGAGGCSMAAKLANKFGSGQVAIIEPRDVHYYQPMWTLVGGGVKTLQQSQKFMKDVLPKKAEWIQDKALAFEPSNNTVITSQGDRCTYEYLIVAMGLQLRFEQIKGLPEAFETPGVCSNYSEKTVEKTFTALKALESGNAIFTFPNTVIKCPGAPQKIMYLTDAYLRKHKKRDNCQVIYNTSLPVIFGVKKYADALWKIVEARGIKVNHRLNLIEVNADKKEAVFENLDDPGGDNQTFKYSLLHVAPPTGPYDEIAKSPLADVNGWLDVDKLTLQHVKYANVFGIGDCTNVPTSKTAAAVAAQTGILYRNMIRHMKGKDLRAKYDGYTSCPLITGYNRCILAEFDFNAQPLETFPIDQGKERWSAYVMKKDFMPELYWQLLLKGMWEGPGKFRTLFHLGMSKKNPQA